MYRRIQPVLIFAVVTLGCSCLSADDTKTVKWTQVYEDCVAMLKTAPAVDPDNIISNLNIDEKTEHAMALVGPSISMAADALSALRNSEKPQVDHIAMTEAAINMLEANVKRVACTKAPNHINVLGNWVWYTHYVDDWFILQCVGNVKPVVDGDRLRDTPAVSAPVAGPVTAQQLDAAVHQARHCFDGLVLQLTPDDMYIQLLDQGIPAGMGLMTAFEGYLRQANPDRWDMVPRDDVDGAAAQVLSEVRLIMATCEITSAWLHGVRGYMTSPRGKGQNCALRLCGANHEADNWATWWQAPQR